MQVTKINTYLLTKLGESSGNVTFNGIVMIDSYEHLDTSLISYNLKL